MHSKPKDLVIIFSCRIYISSPSVGDSETIKLERDKETIVYDMENYFKPAFARYIQQTGPKPSAEIIIAFGQKFNNVRESLNNLLVCAYVTHAEALNQLTRVSTSLLISVHVHV